MGPSLGSAEALRFSVLVSTKLVKRKSCPRAFAADRLDSIVVNACDVTASPHAMRCSAWSGRMQLTDSPRVGPAAARVRTSDDTTA